jgi:hypothetical protein
MPQIWGILDFRSIEVTVHPLRRFIQMNISRRLGILVVFAVPAIIGGGIVYAFFGDYVPVFVYETLLLFVAGGFASK